MSKLLARWCVATMSQGYDSFPSCLVSRGRAKQIELARIRLADLGPDDLGAQHGLVESQLPVQLGHGLRLCLQVDDGADTLGLLVDLVRQAPAAPDVELLYRATGRSDHVEIRVERRCDGALLETSIEDHHDLVMTQDVLTSSGLSGHGPSAAGGHASSPDRRFHPENRTRIAEWAPQVPNQRPCHKDRGARHPHLLGGTWGGTTTPNHWMTRPAELQKAYLMRNLPESLAGR